MEDSYQERVIAIRRRVGGEAPAVIYASMHRSPSWFFKWWARYEQCGLDGLKDLPKAPKHQAHQTSEEIEKAIVTLRTLREKRDTDETKYALVGADAIHRELRDLGYEPPSVRTVHRVMARHGLIVPVPEKERVREIIDRHYPTFEITRPGQLQQLDFVGPNYLTGSSQKYYFVTLRDVCSRRVALEAGKDRKALTVVGFLIRAWQKMGIPSLLQHDNGLEFRGSNRYPRSAGLVTKLCLALGVETLFIPYRQPQRNGSLENFNGLFQRLVLKTQKIDDFQHLQKEVASFEQVANSKHPHIPLKGKTSLEYESLVHFVPTLLAEDFTFNSRFRFEEPPDGKVSFICRIRKSGRITIASEKFEIDAELAWQYVYATIFVKEQKLKIFHNRKLIKEFDYNLKV